MGAAQQRERVHDGVGRVEVVRQRAVRPLLDSAGELGEVPCGQCGLGVEHLQGVDGVEGQVVAEGPQGQSAAGVDVALAEFDAAAAGPQDVEVAGNGLACKGVEDDIDALTTGQLKHLVGEGERAGVQDVVGAQQGQQRALGGTAGGGDDPRADVLGILQGGEAHPAGRAVHQDRLSLP